MRLVAAFLVAGLFEMVRQVDLWTDKVVFYTSDGRKIVAAHMNIHCYIVLHRKLCPLPVNGTTYEVYYYLKGSGPHFGSFTITRVDADTGRFYVQWH